MSSIKVIDRALIVTCMAGIMVSTYALYVEMAAEAKPGYKAMCDISEYASCTRVLTSEFSKGFGFVKSGSALEVPNCIYGIAFYCIMAILTTYENIIMVKIQLGLAIASLFSSCYLAYLLAFVLYDLCLVCVSTYVVNIFLWFFSKKKLVFRKNEIMEKKSK